MNKDALKDILEGQRKWAEHNRDSKNYPRHKDNDNYFTDYNSNLFEGLNYDIKKSFEEGNGNELKDSTNKKGKTVPAKMKALISSSALCVNFFHYLGEKHHKILAKYLNLECDNFDMYFEFKNETISGKSTYPSNIDVALISKNIQSDKSYFIESKFTEPYKPTNNKLGASYFEHEDNNSENKITGNKIDCFKKLPNISKFITDYWDDFKYQPGEDKNHKIIGKKYNSKKSKQNYKCLDIAQLIKHAIALTNSKNEVTIGDKSKFELIYIYFDSPIEEANTKHKKEIEELAEIFKLDKINFRAISYNYVIEKLYKDINSFDEETQKYINYLYFRYIKPYEK